MMEQSQVEELVGLAGTLDQEALVRQLTACRVSFPVDFTPEFLRSLPVDRLRHIFVAVHLHARQMPALAAHAVAG
jgi:hypothetical protein